MYDLQDLYIMAREKNLGRVDYSAGDAHLRDALFDRNLHIPLDEKNKLIRRHAIMLLQEWESRNAHLYTPRKAEVIFHRSPDASAGNMVFASVNSYNMVAPYEVPVIVPEFILKECIDRARTVMRYNSDGIIGNKTEPSYSLVYPYEVLRWIEPDSEEETNEEVQA